MKLFGGIRCGRSTLTMYTDGGCLNNGQKNAKAAWAFFSDNTGERDSGLVKGKQSNNTAELTAILKALLWAQDKTKRLVIYSDSQYAIKCIAGTWRRKKNTKLFELIDEAGEGFENVHFEWVAGHIGVHGNEVTDALCRKELGLKSVKGNFSYKI